MIIETELFNKIHDLTLEDYEPFMVNNEKEQAYINEFNIRSMLEDLVIEVEHWKEKYEDLESQINNDYDPELEIPQIHGEGISW